MNYTKFELTDSGDRFALLACENVVDILIRWVSCNIVNSFSCNFNAFEYFRTEEEIGEDNLKELDIPNNLLDKFEKEL